MVFFKILSFEFEISKTTNTKVAARLAAYFVIWGHGDWLIKVYWDMVSEGYMY